MGNLPGKKVWPDSSAYPEETYFQKFNLLFAGRFALAWESNLELIHHFAV